MSYQNSLFQTKTIAKPFLKWAGGKRKLIPQLHEYFPPQLKNGFISKYVEPFVGSGAVFLYIAQHFQVSKFFLFDINPDLINTYNAIKLNVDLVITILEKFTDEYLEYDDQGKNYYYYEKREEFNNASLKSQEVNFNKAALLIFLNKTCYNGLYRVNSHGKFNVPIGNYKKPRIYKPENLQAVSKLLQNTEIYSGNYLDSESVIDEETFVYFDPPYRPISPSSSFKAYSSDNFNDQQQIELSNFYKFLDNKKHARLMLSNSDPHNVNPNDDFFYHHYRGYQIGHIKASRFINSKASGRGQIEELLIRNYNEDGNLVF